MRYVKCVVAGITALGVVAAVEAALMLLTVVIARRKYASTASPGNSIAVSFDWHPRFWPILLVAIPVFGAGFYWQFKRDKHN